MPLYDMATGTGDFIANGVVSHNCYARPATNTSNSQPGLDFEQDLRQGERAGVAAKGTAIIQVGAAGDSMSGVTDTYQPIEGDCN